MKQPFFFSLCFVSCTGLGWAAGPDFDYTPLDRVLGRFVSERGLVDYPALKAQSDDLNAFVRQLATVSPESHPERFPARADRLAYWINAYNAFVLKSAVDAYPVESVRKIKWFYGFFNRIDHRVGGKPYTLKHIEHHILRTQFDDPRLHAAINCASMGCPRLPQKAFQARSLEEDLESAMQFFLREERNVRIDVAEKRI